ncbi:hypothetical protein NGB36_22890 [Streptomyces sp. RB6PN25]|uniref:Secreted protein n=1 Tax=Streptomyces humicola TaxID=2953240 RepID=A0ABT1Q0A4_9ACTN|nr:hypothetical protein [Streptomyces humicola]MCQ4083372.1 hypothetical protein [Streptomyces humicola]
MTAAAAVTAVVVAVTAAAPAPGGPAAAGPQCYTATQGSTAAAACHNPDPEQVWLRLHIRCARWWDPSVDTAAATVGPAQTIVLSGRCWKEIRAVWVTLTRR